MSRFNLLALLAGASLICGPHGAHGQQSPASPQSTSRTQGGVTADEVGQVIINNNLARPHDPDRERVAAMMVRYLQQAAAMHTQYAEQLRQFIILQDPRDSIFRSEVGSGKVFVFVAGDEEALENSTVAQAPRCAFQDGTFMSGLVITTTIEREAQFSQEFLNVDHQLFVNLCDSLGDDARVAENGGVLGGDPITNFDLLSSGDLPVVFTFLPSERAGVPFEVAVAREFWLGAVSSVSPFQMPEIAQRELERRYGRSRLATMEEQARESGAMSVRMELQSLGLTQSFSALRALTRRDFGRPFDELDDAWARSLSNTQVSVDGRRARLSADGVLTPRLPRFTVEEVGTPLFWRHVSDVTDFDDSIRCAATRFAVERDYARARDLPNYAECVSANIRALRAQRD